MVFSIGVLVTVVLKNKKLPAYAPFRAKGRFALPTI